MSKLLYDVDKWGGQSSLIHKEKLPIALIRSIRNGILSKRLGVVKKRPRYANILTTGLTALKGMMEFVDQNDGRQILIQDGTGLEESVYSSGYGAIGAISNDERTSGSTVDQMYPVLWRKELRSPAGLNAATDRAFWYGYIAERKRFNDNETISAGKYADEQFYNSKFAALDIVSSYVKADSSMTDTGIIVDGVYFLFMAPVLDGYQRGFPDLSATKRIMIIDSDVTPERIWIDLVFSNTNKLYLKRMTAIDLFIGKADRWSADFGDLDPIYFLERIDLNSDGNVFLQKSGNVGVTTANKIVVAAYADWLSFPSTDMWIHDTTNDKYYRITAQALDTPGAGEVEFTVSPNAAADGSATLEFFTRWTDNGSGVYSFATFFDNYYKKLGSEMFTYLNIPAGDEGLDDYRYKIGSMANKVYWIFGGTEEYKGYYSKPYAPDVIPVLNEVSIEKDPKAVIPVGNDVIVFYKDGAKRFNWYGNKNVTEEENYSDRGCTNQKAWAKKSDYEIFGFDYTGPWLMRGREFIDIGVDLVEWWGGTDSDNLTDAQKDACVVLYNPKLQLVFYSFPDYTTAPYAAGFVAIFDLKSFGLNKGMLPWLLMDTDTAIKSGCISDDVHLLTGSATKIVDWNNDTPTETCDFYLKLKLLRNALAGDVKTWWDKVRMTYDTDDTVTLTAIYDEGSGSALTLLSNDAAMMRKIAQELELEISTVASANEVEVSRVQVFGEPRGF